MERSGPSEESGGAGAVKPGRMVVSPGLTTGSGGEWSLWVRAGLVVEVSSVVTGTGSGRMTREPPVPEVTRFRSTSGVVEEVTTGVLGVS